MVKKKEEIPIYIIKELIWNMSNKPSWIQAFSTVVLVGVTIAYVVYTREQVKIQELQFKVLNAADVVYTNIFGTHKSGTITFENKGNLSAEDFKIIWKIIKAGGDKVSKTYSAKRIETYNIKKISSKQEIQIRYGVELEPTEYPVFFILAWRYKSQFANETEIKTMHFYWWVQNKPPVWTPYATLSAEHDAVIRKTKDGLIQSLKHDEND